METIQLKLIEDKLLCNADEFTSPEPCLYFWLIPNGSDRSFPIYIGETGNLKNRMREHIENILLGKYFNIHKRDAKGYYSDLKEISGCDTW